jgi:hypothetical protein
VILGIFGLIYLSGFFGTQQSYVQYIWDSKNTPIQLPDSAVTHFQDGPYPYEQMSNYLKTYYPDAKVTTLDSNLAFELHQPQILKYSYCAPNPYFCQLHYQEVNLKISDSQINLLSIYLPISNPDQLASLESINNQLTNYFGENSVFRISQSILDEFKPIFAVNQYSSMVVYLVRGLTT